MDIKVDLDADAVNRTVTDAIVNSVIGVEIRKAIEAQMKEFTSTYNNPLHAVVKDQVRSVVERILTVEYRTKIEQSVRELVTDEMISEIAQKAWESLKEKRW